MNQQITALNRPLGLMDGVNGLFAQVLGGVQIPIYTPDYYPLALKDIRAELKEIRKSTQRRLDFQNLPAVYAERVGYLQMAELHYSMAIIGYPAMIDLSPLSWPNKLTGLPLFGVLEIKPKSLLGIRDPKSSQFSISVAVPYSGWEETRVTYQPNIPYDLKKHYFPVARKLESVCLETLGRGNTIFISTEFAGEMPLPLEKYIQGVLSKGHFPQVFAIFQAPEWKFGHQVLVDKDPILVGRVNHKVLGSQYFFLGIFDPGKWESHIAENFTFGPRFLRKS